MYNYFHTYSLLLAVGMYLSSNKVGVLFAPSKREEHFQICNMIDHR
jgi:hypothetical protein